MDETTCQVLREPGRPPDKKSYMRITIGYTDEHRPILVYHYHPSRSERIPLSILKNYKGYLQTDGYIGYAKIGKELANKVFEIERRKLIKPILDKIKKYLLDNLMAVPPKSKLGTAINYALKKWDKLEHYLDKWFLTPEGAHSSAAMFSLIQTAEANGLNVDKYLKTIFTKLPLAENEEEIRKLLPTAMKKEDLLK